MFLLSFSCSIILPDELCSEVNDYSEDDSDSTPSHPPRGIDGDESEVIDESDESVSGLTVDDDNFLIHDVGNEGDEDEYTDSNISCSSALFIFLLTSLTNSLERPRI